MRATKSLIACFSRKGNNYVGGCILDLPVGNTEVAATMIQKLTGSDAFKIDTVKGYPSDSNETTEIAQQELRQNARPVLTGHVGNMDDYRVIFLGYPNWWGTMPMAVCTFLETYDLSGKTIVPFCTHEGSGMGERCQEALPQRQGAEGALDQRWKRPGSGERDHSVAEEIRRDRSHATSRVDVDDRPRRRRLVCCGDIAYAHCPNRLDSATE